METGRFVQIGNPRKSNGRPACSRNGYQSFPKLLLRRILIYSMFLPIQEVPPMSQVIAFPAQITPSPPFTRDPNTAECLMLVAIRS